MTALLICASGSSFATYNDYIDWLTNNAPSAQVVTAGLTSGIKNVGEHALTAGEALTPYTQQLGETWSTLPRETQQVILGGAALAAAAYHSPTLYHYLWNNVESEKQRVLAQAQQSNAIFPVNLERIPPSHGGFYNQVLAYFNFGPAIRAPLKDIRSHLLFFKYVKIAVEDQIYAAKYDIKQKILTSRLSRAGIFLQKFWTTDNDLQLLNKLTDQHKLLTKIIAQLEKEISYQLSY